MTKTIYWYEHRSNKENKNRFCKWFFLSWWIPAGKYWSQGRPEGLPFNVTRTSFSFKILFDHPRDVPNWHPGDVSIWRPWDVSKWRPGDVLFWYSRDVPRRVIRDVLTKFSRRGLEDLQSTSKGWCGVFCWISLISFLLFFRDLFDWPNLFKNNSILKLYLEPSRTSKMEFFLRNLLMAFSR